MLVGQQGSQRDEALRRQQIPSDPWKPLEPPPQHVPDAATALREMQKLGQQAIEGLKGLRLS